MNVPCHYFECSVNGATLNGQSIIIDNRGGAATVIGAEIASNSAPDGYTLLPATVSTLAVAPAQLKAHI